MLFNCAKSCVRLEASDRASLRSRNADLCTRGISPEFEDEASAWMAPDASLIGRVRLDRNVGIWFGVVIRGDNEAITIGPDTNVQEHA